MEGDAQLNLAVAANHLGLEVPQAGLKWPKKACSCQGAHADRDPPSTALRTSGIRQVLPRYQDLPPVLVS